MNYIFYAAKAVKLKACVTKFLHHICLLSPLPLSAWEVPEPNTLNPVSFGCPFQSFVNVTVKWVLLLWSTRPIVICSEFWVCLLGSAYIQSAFISGMQISFDRFSLAHEFLILAPPIPGCYFLLCKPPPPPCLFMLSIPISDILPLVPSKNLSHIKIFPWKPKQRGQKGCVLVSHWCGSCAFMLHVSFAGWHFYLVPETSLTGKPPLPLARRWETQHEAFAGFSHRTWTIRK